MLGNGWAQVWDVLPGVVAKTHYELLRLRDDHDRGTGRLVNQARYHTATITGSVIVLGSEGNVPVERVAILPRATLQGRAVWRRKSP